MPKRILVVDDHPKIRKVLRGFVHLQNDREVCGEAEDGVDAIDKAMELKPDLIILDFKMPRLNGLEAARVLSAALPAVPIVLFTMHKELLQNVGVKELGIRAVVSKTNGLAPPGQQMRELLPGSTLERRRS
jgi:NarL family two-component system response regulator LiaR